MDEKELSHAEQLLRIRAEQHGREPPIRVKQALRQKLEAQAPVGPLTASLQLLQDDLEEEQALEEAASLLHTFADLHGQEPPLRVQQALQERLQQEAPVGPLTKSLALLEEDFLEASAPEDTQTRPAYWHWLNDWMQRLRRYMQSCLRHSAYPKLAAGFALAVIIAVLMLPRQLVIDVNLRLASVPVETVKHYVTDASKFIDLGFAPSAIGKQKLRVMLGVQLGSALIRLQAFLNANDSNQVDHLINNNIKPMLAQLKAPAELNQALAMLEKEYQGADSESWTLFSEDLADFADSEDLKTALEFGAWVENLYLSAEPANDSMLKTLLKQTIYFKTYFDSLDIVFPEGLDKAFEKIEKIAVKSNWDRQDYKLLARTAKGLIPLFAP